MILPLIHEETGPKREFKQNSLDNCNSEKSDLPTFKVNNSPYIWAIKAFFLKQIICKYFNLS